jgi:hypothetical protein
MMTGNEPTRRKFLHWVGAASVIGLPVATARGRHPNDGRVNNQYDVDPDALVVEADDLPDVFEEATPSEDPALPTQQQDIDPALEDAATALTGYWAGEQEYEPRQVVASFVSVCDAIPDRSAVESAVADCVDDMAAVYARSPSVQISQSRRTGSNTTMWRIDLTGAAVADHYNEPVAGASDLLHVQYCGNVLLETAVFGPRRAVRDADSLLATAVGTQRRKFRAEVTTDV